MKIFNSTAAFLGVAGAAYAFVNAVGTLAPVGHAVFSTLDGASHPERILLPISPSWSDAIDITNAYSLHRNFTLGTGLFLAAMVVSLGSYFRAGAAPSNQRRWALTIVGMFVVVCGAAYLSAFRNSIQLFEVLSTTSGADPYFFGNQLGSALLITRIGAVAGLMGAASMVLFSIITSPAPPLKNFPPAPLIVLVLVGVFSAGAFFLAVQGNFVLQNIFKDSPESLDPSKLAGGISSFLGSSMAYSLLIFIAGIGIAVGAWLRPTGSSEPTVPLSPTTP